MKTKPVLDIEAYFTEKTGMVLDELIFYHKRIHETIYEKYNYDFTDFRGILYTTRDFINDAISEYKRLKQLYEAAWNDLTCHKDNVESCLNIYTEDESLKRIIERGDLC